jgi:AcrR family transcriptional regulator
MTSLTRYHHGDLRNALLQAGIDILEGEGLAALSLRAIAARAGVSHAAPAHHFKNLQALITALAAIGFQRFAATLAAERAAASPEPAAQMRAATQGYLAFARAHPALFRLMFSGVDLDWQDHAELIVHANAAFAHLAEIAAPAAVAAGDTSPEGHARMQTLVWSVTHGFARLVMDCEAALPVHKAGVPVDAPDLAALLFPTVKMPSQPR